MEISLESVANELYGLPLADFTARRAVLAKQLRTEDKELSEAVARLPKPVAAAWALNHFARQRADELEDLLTLGEQLREAQGALAGARMKALTANATALVQRTLKGVAGAADQPLTGTILAQVEQTLRAALADPDAAAAVRAGVLVKPLASGGFGPVDPEGALALVPAARPPKATERRLSVVRPKVDERREQARKAAEAALIELEHAESELADCDRELQTASAQHDAEAQRVAELRTELEAAVQSAREAAERLREAKKTQEQASRATAKATEAAQRAKRAVETL